MPWEFVGKSTNYTKVCVIHRLYTMYYTTQNNPWICRYRFNGKVIEQNLAWLVSLFYHFWYVFRCMKLLYFFLFYVYEGWYRIKSKKLFHWTYIGKSKDCFEPITPSFVLYIEYTFIHFGMSISCKQGSLLISK
jgi:hypothetical protein